MLTTQSTQDSHIITGHTMKKIRLLPRWIVLMFLFFSLGSNALAGETKDQGNWQFSLAPFYLWGVSIDGDMMSGGSTSDVDVPIGDVFTSLEAAFIVHFDVLHKSNFGFYVDVNALEIKNTATLPMGHSLDIDLGFKLTEVAGYYRIQKGNHYFDTVAGLRYVKITTEVTPINGPTLVDAKLDWTDPIIGGRYIWAFAEDWKLTTLANMGGFGIGSEFSWEALGMIEWKPFEYVSFLGGYRALSLDYEEDKGPASFNLDLTMSGPVIGVNFRW